MKNDPHRALYEGEDVRALLNVPGVDRHTVRDFFARHGLLELFDVIDKAR
jgi:methylmalonyl-CoA mutase cobalamin-binding subunit